MQAPPIPHALWWHLVELELRLLALAALLSGPPAAAFPTVAPAASAPEPTQLPTPPREWGAPDWFVAYV